MWARTDDALTAPATPQFVTIRFEKGIPVKVSSEGKAYTDSLELFIALNAIGKAHGIGRIDIVETRFIGIKSRGCYDAPGMTILRLAHLDLEGLVLDARVRSLRDQFVTHSYIELIYNVRLKLFGGLGRSSPRVNADLTRGCTFRLISRLLSDYIPSSIVCDRADTIIRAIIRGKLTDLRPAACRMSRSTILGFSLSANTFPERRSQDSSLPRQLRYFREIF